MAGEEEEAKMAVSFIFCEFVCEVKRCYTTIRNDDSLHKAANTFRTLSQACTKDGLARLDFVNADESVSIGLNGRTLCLQGSSFKKFCSFSQFPWCKLDEGTP